MLKLNQLKGIQQKYAKSLRLNFVFSIVTILSGFGVLALYFTVFSNNRDVLFVSVQLLTAGLIIGIPSMYLRFNEKAFKKRATMEYDERNRSMHKDTITLSYYLSALVLLVAVLVLLYVEPLFSVLLMCAVIIFGVIYIISYLIIRLANRVGKE